MLPFVLLLAATLLPISTHAAGSTVPVFNLDATNSSSFTTTGSSVNSSISEAANGVSGTSTSVTLDSSSPSPAFVFSGSQYMNFANNIKPDFTNGASIQFVAKLNSSSSSGTWERVFDLGYTGMWGSGYDNISVQISQTGQIQVYMSRTGTSGSYTCWSDSNQVVLDTFALYSIKVGTGVCTVNINGGTSVASTSSEATTAFAARIPSTSSTWALKVGSRVDATASLFYGNLRALIISSGTTSSNSVVFMPNGGTGYTPSQVGSTSVTLNSNQYTRAGYQFNGWNTKADGTGTSYNDGATYNLASASSMLFAQWIVPAPTLSLAQITGATFRTAKSLTLTINSSGRYTFFDSGKRIAGCIGLNGTPPTVTCNWKPTKVGGYVITALGRINSSNYYSNSATVVVSARNNNR